MNAVPEYDVERLASYFEQVRNEQPDLDDYSDDEVFQIQESRIELGRPYSVAQGLWFTEEQRDEAISLGPDSFTKHSFVSKEQLEKERVARLKSERDREKLLRIRAEEGHSSRVRRSGRSILVSNAGNIVLLILGSFVFLWVTGNLNGAVALLIYFALGALAVILSDKRYGSTEEALFSAFNAIPYIVTVLWIQPRYGLAHGPLGLVSAAECFFVAELAGYFSILAGQALLWRLWRGKRKVTEAVLITANAPFWIVMAIYWFYLAVGVPTIRFPYQLFCAVVIGLGLITLVWAVRRKEEDEPFQWPNHRTELARLKERAKKTQKKRREERGVAGPEPLPVPEGPGDAGDPEPA